MQYEGIKERKIVKSYLATVTYIGTLEKEEIESITFNIKYKEMPQEDIEEKTKSCCSGRNEMEAGMLYCKNLFPSTTSGSFPLSSPGILSSIIQRVSFLCPPL